MQRRSQARLFARPPGPAAGFIGAQLKQLSLPIERLSLVPGNDDLDRRPGAQCSSAIGVLVPTVSCARIAARAVIGRIAGVGPMAPFRLGDLIYPVSQPASETLEPLVEIESYSTHCGMRATRLHPPDDTDRAPDCSNEGEGDRQHHCQLRHPHCVHPRAFGTPSLTSLHDGPVARMWRICEKAGQRGLARGRPSRAVCSRSMRKMGGRLKARAGAVRAAGGEAAQPLGCTRLGLLAELPWVELLATPRGLGLKTAILDNQEKR
jgi:hypothetical protein